jgi:ketosteroid isomerase-like protein
MDPSTTPIGDPVPEAIGGYLAAIDAADADLAASWFAADCRYAVPSPGASETDPRTETIGRSSLRDRFHARGRRPWRHVVTACVLGGDDGFIEGVTVDRRSDAAGGFAASFRLDSDGRIERYLAYVTADLPDPIPTDLAVDQRPADAIEVVEGYFHALDGGRFEDASACFSEDIVYSHPPYRHTGIDGAHRVVFRGRTELLAAFRARGRASFDHEVLVSVQRGPHCLFEGVVRGLPDDGDGSFVSSLSLAADGTIRRYVSFYCEPAVARTV